MTTVTELAQAIMKMPHSKATPAGLKLVADCILSDDNSIEEVKAIFGESYFKFLVSVLKMRINQIK